MKLAEATETGNLTKIARENININEKYQKWSNELSRIIESTMEKEKTNKKHPLKIERKLNKVKKMIRKRKDWTIQMKKKQIKKINELIEKEIKQHKAKVTMKMAQTLQSENKMHAGTFYEFKKQMDRRDKGEVPSVMINKEGKEVTNRDEIREVYADFYKDLFEQDKPFDDIEKKADRVRQMVFDSIMKESERPIKKEKITKQTYIIV